MPDTLFVGKNNIFLKEIDSTQAYATLLLSKTSPHEGTSIITDYQSAGKGQIGRYWHSSAEKNLLVSYILYPNFLEIEPIFFLNIVSSLAITDLCHAYQMEAKIKWPNDIYIGDKKLSGTLIQNTFKGNSIKNTIVGIGLNVNEDDFPNDLPNPISIYQSLGRSVDVKEVFYHLSFFLEKRYLQLKYKDKESLWDAYHELLYKKNEKCIFQRSDTTSFEGSIQGITRDGHLKILTYQGIETFDLREIKFVL